MGGTVLIALSVTLWHGRLHDAVATIVSSFVGAALISSGVGALIMKGIDMTGTFKSNLHIDTSPDVVWVDFLFQLLLPASKTGKFIDTAGIFKQRSPQGWPLDRISGSLLWLFVFIVRLAVPLRKLLKEQKKEKPKQKEKRSETEESEEPTNKTSLRKPLLKTPPSP